MTDRRRRRNGLGMTIDTSSTFTIRRPDDVFGMIPYLLGFRPADSVVILVLDDGCIRMTARIDGEVALHRPDLHERMRSIKAQFPNGELIAVAYADSRDLGRRCLLHLSIEARNPLWFGFIVVGNRYWEFDCADGSTWGGDEFDDRSSAAAAQAVSMGLTAVESRDELLVVIAPPDAATLETARQTADDLGERLVAMSLKARRARADALVLQLRVGQPLVPELLIELGLLIGDIRVRDRLWMRFRRETADLDVALWAAVVRALPPEHSVPALCLTGMAAWLTGNGVLLAACLNQAEALNGDYSMLRIMHDIVTWAAPPQVWDSMVE